MWLYAIMNVPFRLEVPEALALMVAQPDDCPDGQDGALGECGTPE